MGKSEDYELDGILRDVVEQGWATVRLRKLYRLLGKANRAAGTWSALLDAWEEIGESRSGLYITELQGELILLANKSLDSAKSWANE